MQTKDFNTLVSEQIAAVQGGASSLVDTTIGSILRAVVEAYSAVAMWLQGMILNLLIITRASTASGADLDSWMADYGVERIAAGFATAQVTFSRFTASQQAVIYTGTIVQTSDSSQQYTVTADKNNANYDVDLDGYIIAADIQSIQVPVVAVTAGAAANVAIGGINTIGQPIPYVDSVTNEAAVTNGENEESDVEFRSRFINYISSLSKATKSAIGYAVSSYQTGITYKLFENQQYDGTERLGYFFAVVDDGTGTPSSELIDTISNRIEAVRGFTINFSVFAPVIQYANISMTITTASGYTHAAIVTIVDAALTNYVNSLGLGNDLNYTSLAGVAYGASPAVTNVSSVMLNSGTADINIDGKKTIKAGTISVA